jgi:hypothetical protein
VLWDKESFKKMLIEIMTKHNLTLIEARMFIVPEISKQGQVNWSVFQEAYSEIKNMLSTNTIN